MDTKQKAIEEAIDNHTGEMGRDMIALIALHSRITVQQWKADRFITEFSGSLGFKYHIDTAVRVINYLYPKNRRDYWKVWDKIYSDRVKNSAWIKHNSNPKQA